LEEISFTYNKINRTVKPL